MILGCCISIDHYDTVVKAGYEELTLAGVDITSYSDEKFEEVKKIIKNGPLKTISINSYCPGSIRFHGEGYDPEAIRSYTEKLCQRGSELGYRYIGIGAPVSKKLLPGEDKAKADKEMDEALTIMCEVAAKYGMEILMESITSLDTNYYNTTRECYALVKRLGLKNFHLVYDIYHEWCEGEGPEVIRETIDEIKVVHLSNLEKGKRSYLKESDTALYKSYYDVLKKCGYQGEFNIECFDPDPDEKIISSMKILKALEG